MRGKIGASRKKGFGKLRGNYELNPPATLKYESF